MSNHTPGPWKALRSNEEFDGLLFERDPDDDPYPITRIASKDKTVAAAHDLFEFTEEDARLIVAAPDLLAALKSVLSMPDWDGTMLTSAARKQAKRRARAAIAKAGG